MSQFFGPILSSILSSAAGSAAGSGAVGAAGTAAGAVGGGAAGTGLASTLSGLASQAGGALTGGAQSLLGSMPQTLPEGVAGPTSPGSGLLGQVMNQGSALNRGAEIVGTLKGMQPSPSFRSSGVLVLDLLNQLQKDMDGSRMSLPSMPPLDLTSPQQQRADFLRAFNLQG